MLKIWPGGILFMLFSLSAACQRQEKKAIGELFFEYSNNYRVDSLAALLADDFELRRSYTTVKDNKESFLKQYMLYSKELNGKFHVIKTVFNEEPQVYRVKDESDYYKYIGIVPPEWSIEIATSEGKITSVLIDTTAGYYIYAQNSRDKGEAFTNWTEKNYPGETFSDIVKTPGLLNKRFKEFAAGRNKP